MSDDQHEDVPAIPPRLHIAGSASGACDVALLKLAHAVVADVVRRHASVGGSFVIGIGAEPVHDDGAPALVFDWTALETALALLESGAAVAQTVRVPFSLAVLVSEALIRCRTIGGPCSTRFLRPGRLT